MTVKQKYFIDIHKGVTPVFIIGLIGYYYEWDNFVALVYLALNGTYVLLLIRKSSIFPEHSFPGSKTWQGLSR